MLDVFRFGPLDSFSAYSFENLLQILKNLVRKSAKPLQQLVKRIGEIEIVQMMSARENIETAAPRNPLTNYHRKGPLFPNISGLQYENLLFKETKISVTMPNNCIFLSGNRVALVENFIKTNNGEIIILARQFMNEGDFFNVPLPSRQINYVEVWNLSSELAAWAINDVVGKAFIMPSFLVPTPVKPLSYVAALLLTHDTI